MTTSVNMGLQLTVCRLFSPDPKDKLETLSKLDESSLQEESIRCALTTLADFEKNTEVREAAKSKLGLPCQK
jgi:hypothetical protein